ncbi:unnamed protein product [Boreogadus saida]
MTASERTYPARRKRESSPLTKLSDREVEKSDDESLRNAWRRVQTHKGLSRDSVAGSTHTSAHGGGFTKKISKTTNYISSITGTVVTVSDSAVKAPNVFPLVQCGSGTGEVTIGCMATGFMPASLTFKWEFGGSELADAVQYPTSKKDNQYTGVSQIRVRRQDWDTRKPFTCSAVHAGGTVTADVLKQEVVHKLPALSILISETESRAMVSFGCFAANFSPKDYTITWLRNGKKIDPSESSTSSEGKKNENGTFYNAASYIQVEENRWKDDGTNITCTFANKEEHVDAHLTYGAGCGGDDPPTSTKFEIDILPISLETMYLENNAELVCKVQSRDPVEVKWFNESGEVLSNSTNPSSNTYIATAMIKYDEWSKGMNWYCEASIKDSIEVPTRKDFVKNNGPNRVPPSVYLLPPVDDLSCTNLTLTCFVKDFYPEDVLVHWLVDNLTIDGNSLYSHKTTNVIENGDLFSTYGQLTFSSDGWKDGRVFRCEVYHMSMDSKNQPIVKLITEKSSGNVNIINMNMGPSTCLPQ